MEMPHDASSAFDLRSYRLSKIKEYSQTTLNVFNFASIKFCNSNCETKYIRNYKHFVHAKFDTREIQNTFNEK